MIDIVTADKLTLGFFQVDIIAASFLLIDEFVKWMVCQFLWQWITHVIKH
jgi:hypothetical protein